MLFISRPRYGSLYSNFQDTVQLHTQYTKIEFPFSWLAFESCAGRHDTVGRQTCLRQVEEVQLGGDGRPNLVPATCQGARFLWEFFVYHMSLECL